MVKKNWFKRHPLLTGFFSLLIFLFIIGIFSNFSEDRKFIEEYNTKLDNVNKLFVEHEEIRIEVNSNLNNYPLYYEKIEEYIKWVEMNGPEIGEFRLFIESNHEKLWDLGVNPDYVRSNVISLIEVMQENDVRFREVLAYYNFKEISFTKTLERSK